MVHTRDEVIRVMTENYLNSLNMANLPAPDVIQENILTNVETALKTENAMRDKGDKFRYVHELLPAQIAMILVRLYPIVKISSSTAKGVTDYDVLAIYQDSGPDEGIYLTSYTCFRNLIRTYSYTIKDNEIEETLKILNDTAPRVEPCRDRDLIAVNNGIFNYKSKQLLPFTPDKVFLSKSKVDYNPNATNPIIMEPDGGQWDVESWMLELMDDPEMTNLLWCIIGAAIRPNVPWNRSTWFFATTGNNGKGTLTELMRSLCGEGTYTSIPLADMGKDFMLESLVHASAIIVDENDVGQFVDKAANFKAIVTNDVIQINRKFMKPITIQSHCFMVQCCNELPRFRDKSSSLTRRLLIVPFTKSFTGHEKKYIKNDFLHRQDVLEYVLRRVLEIMPAYYELPEPEACKLALDDYRQYNNPVLAFLDEVLSELVWDLVPWSFLYDLYKAWFHRTNPSGSIQGRTTFIQEVQAAIPNYPDTGYIALASQDKRRPKNMMVEPEYLIHDYDLTDWMNPSYAGVSLPNIDAQCRFPVYLQADKYSGLLRVTPKVAPSDPNE